MKRLFLPFMMLCLLFVGKVQAQRALNYTPRADGEVVDVMIGDSTATTTDSYLPTYSLYDYSFTQQIYTADEIGYGGTINSLTMWLKNNSSYARNLNVYMKETGDASFADGSSWVSMTDGDMVASFTLDNGITSPVATKVILSTPFEYSGSGNLVLCIQDVTGDWSSGAAGVVMETSVNQAIYHYRDGSLYDPTTPGVNGYIMAKKDIVKLNITPNGGDTPDIPNEYFYISASGWAIWDAAPESYPEEPTCVIDAVDITGFVAPEEGNNPVFDLGTGDSNYTITYVEWDDLNGEIDETDVFTGGNTYYVYLEVEPVDGCTFSEQGLTVTFDGDDYPIESYEVENGILYILSIDYEIDENPDECVINTIEIENFVEPELGGSTDLTFTYPTGDYTLAAGWFDGDVNAYTDATFAVGQYYFYVQMTPNSDDCTVEDLTYYINGEEVEPIASGISSSGDYYYFYMSYTVIDPSVTCGGFDTGFETGEFCDWTTLDADGDGFCWEMSDGTTETHNNSLFSVNSASYNNDSGNPLTPDNYLISPKTLITADKPYLSFWACAQDASFAAEYFGVGVSTTTATASAFTMLNNWTLSAKKGVQTNGKTRGDIKAVGSWYNYKVDLSAYIGDEVYVAIRHYNCTDMFYINIDDIELIEAPEPPAPITDVIDFETNDFSQANFTMDANYPWVVTNADNNTNGGSYCMKSGNEGVDSSTSEMILEVNVEETKAISFWAKISSESNWDKGYFSIDGTNKINGISGSTSWTNYSYMLEAGTHTLRWYYTKDSSTSSNDDCFYVDDIEIVEYVPEPLFPITFESGDFPDQVIVINNDGDSKAFTIASSGAYEGTYCATVGYNGYGNDDWLIFPVTPEAGQSVSLYAKSGSATYLESFEIAVSTTTATVANFTALESFTDIPNSYEEYTTDLSAYAGQDIYVAVHCVSIDKLTFYVDNIDIVSAKKGAVAQFNFKNLSGKQAIAHNGKKHEVMKARKATRRIEFIAPNFWGAKGNRDGEDMFVSYNLYLDGNLVAEGITDLDYYMQEAENFTDGSSHIAKIEAVYESGATVDMTKAWTFQSGDHFTGAPEGLAVNVEGTTANLSWELPEAGLVVTDLFYDFEDGSLGDLTSLNANNDSKYWVATMSYPSYAYEGSGMAIVSYAAPNDDYLITPQIRPTEGSVFSFYANNDGGSTYPETFEVMVSTTGMEAADFTPITDMITISGSYQLFEYGLGDYAGQDIYLAIHNVSDDMDIMCVDNMSITSVETELSHVGAVVYRDGEIVAKLRNGETSYTEELEGSDIPTYCISIIQNGSKDAGVYYALAEKQCVEQVVVACQAPYDLAAVADGSDVTLTWNMDGEKPVLLFDDFEDGALTNWTTIDADGDGETWENATPAAYGIGDAYSGTNCASSWSWNSYTLYPDNYMISPLVEGATSLHYYVATNSAYPDHYGVYASTTGIDTTDFVLLFEETAGNSKGGVKGAARSSKTQAGTREMSSWIEKTITLPAGTKYVAFRHWNSDDMNYLFIDDVTIYGEEIPSTATYNIYSSTDGENYTILAAGVEGTTYTDEDLEPGTYYYQVTANNVVATGDCESEPALAENGDDNFVMVEIEVVEPCVAPISLAAEVNGDDNSVTVTWDIENDVIVMGVNVYRSTDGENYELVAELTNGEASYTDEDLEDGTYYYQVTSTNMLSDQSYCESDPALADDGQNFVMVEIGTPQPQTCETPINLVATVEGDDVTLTWEMPGQGGGDVETYFTFDTDLQGWINIDANNDGRLWFHSSQHPDYDYSGLDAEGGDGFLVSASYEDGTGSSFQANNYIYAPYRYTIASGSQFNFAYDYGSDDYPDYFAVVVSTVDNPTSANDFVEIWTVDAKNATSNKAAKRHAQGTRYQNWQQVTVDLSEYAGQQIWIGFHHSDYDEYEVWIDNVEITNATKDGGDVTFNIYRSEDGVDYELIAEGVTDMTYLDEDLDYGTYYYQVVAVTDVCESDPAEVEATIVEPVNECIAPFDLAATLEGNDVTLTWDYIPAGATVYDFEAEFAAQNLGDWTTIDADGDTYTWFIRPTGLAALGHNDSEGFVTSASYGTAALNPDNYLVSPQITISDANNMLSFWACAQDASWPSEHFGVAVSTTGNTSAADFTMLQEWTMTAKVQGNWYEYTVDLSAYDGQDIYVAIRHFDCTDLFRLNVDDISFTGTSDNTTFNVYRSTDGEEYELIAEGVDEMTYTDEDLDFGTYYYQVTANGVLSDGTDCESEPALDVDGEEDFVMVELIEPTYECIAAINLDATVDGGSAILTWEMPTGESYEYDFEGGLNGWTTFEGADAETTWIHSDNNLGGYDYTTHAHSGTGFAMSYSFVDNVSAYQADNYLVSPVKYSIENGTTMTFFYDFANESYADFFAVEVSTGSNNTAADFTEVWSTDGKKANGGNAIVRKVNGTRLDNWQEATIDLSAFAGQEVWIAFHHEDNDMYEVWIDDVTVGAGASAPLFNIYRSTDGENYELIAEGVEDMNYTDTGLSDGTYYYQVTSVLYDYDGEVACESDPALAVNGEDDFVMVTIDGIEDFSSLINVYPNPTRANVNIEAEGLSNIVVFNALGQVVYEVNATDDHVVVNMSNFGAGVYMFNIITNNGTTVKRVTVAK